MKALRMITFTIIGGLLYFFFLLITRGHSHWTMIIVGGICGFLVGGLDEMLSWEMPFSLQCVLGAIVVTAVEFVSGCIINLWLGWDVWDYSGLPCNLLGQICLPFTLLWIVVCMIWIPIYDLTDYMLFDGERPHYKFF